MTRHNGRAGKNGVYNPKHNDRQFNVDHADHIDAVRQTQNIYWDCFKGARNSWEQSDSFEEVEKKYYFLFYHNSVEAQNARNIQNRHPERNKTTDDLLLDKRTCPEESILQIGNLEDSIDGETLAIVAHEFFVEMKNRYGEHLHFLDWSLHMDEGTPHIHERHVFDCEDNYGFLKPQQEKALELLGIPLPDPNKKSGKNNNRKMTFDKICRELFVEICEKHGLHVDHDPTYGGRAYMEKQDYIIMAQKQKLEKLEAELEAKTLKLQDIDAIAEEVSETAYEKACEVVTEAVQAETIKADIQTIDDYRSEILSPQKRLSDSARSLIGRVLDSVQARLKKAAGNLLQKVSDRLHEPGVKGANKEEIRTVTKRSLLELLHSHQASTENQSSNRKPKKKTDLERD